jgi:transcriptional regulator with XRE-family HTH domain
MNNDANRSSARSIVAKNLRSFRAKQGWSQEDLALEAGLHRTFVSHVEREARNISIDNLEKLARALKVPLCDLLILRDKTPPG